MPIIRLVELQDIDSQLEDLNSLLGDLPKMVDELNEKENSIKNKVEADKTSLKDISLNTSKSETANQEIQSKIDKLTDQLFLVTNNKQYDALTSEIEHLKAQKEEHETLLITYLEDKEILEENVKNNESSLEELKTDLEIKYFPNPYESYQMNTQADISNTKKYLNFEPKYSLEQGIKAYIPEILRLHDTDNS